MRRFLVAGLVVAGVLGVLGDAYLQALGMGRSLEALFPRLQGARAQLLAGDGGEDALSAVIQEAEALHRRARGARFTFALTGTLPLLGRPVDAARLGAAAAFEATRALAVARDLAEDALGTEEGGSPLLSGGVIDVEALGALTPRVDEAIGHLEAADRSLRAIPRLPFVDRIEGMKAQAVAQSQEALRLARRARSGLELLPSFLGAEEPRTYFLALQNNADQRATGGAALAYGLLRIDDGRIGLLRGGSVPYDFDFDEDGARTGVPVALPGAVRWYLDAVEMPPWVANLNYTPDFPVVAETWARQIATKTGVEIGGVIALDQVGISYLLKRQPPLRVHWYPKPIRAGNVVFVTANDQYRLPPWQQELLAEQLVLTAFQALTDPTDPAAMLDNVGAALAEKRIQIWSSRPEEQRLISEMGWDGALTPTAGDYLFVTTSKRNTGKQDFFLRKRIHYTVRLTEDGDADATATVRLINEIPPGEPRLVAGRPYGLNVAMLNVYVPRRASEDPEVRPAGRLGGRGPRPRPRGFLQHVERRWRVYTKTVKAWPSRYGEATFSYRVPDAVRETPRGRVYELTVPHQPMVEPTHLDVTVVLPPGVRVEEASDGWSVRGRVAHFTAELTHEITARIEF